MLDEAAQEQIASMMTAGKATFSHTRVSDLSKVGPHHLHLHRETPPLHPHPSSLPVKRAYAACTLCPTPCITRIRRTCITRIRRPLERWNSLQASVQAAAQPRTQHVKACSHALRISGDRVMGANEWQPAREGASLSSVWLFL